MMEEREQEQEQEQGKSTYCSFHLLLHYYYHYYNCSYYYRPSSALLLFSLAFSTLLLSTLLLSSSSSSSYRTIITPWLSSSSSASLPLASFSPNSIPSEHRYTSAFQPISNARQGPRKDKVVAVVVVEEEEAKEEAKEEEEEEEQQQQVLIAAKEEEEVDKGIPHADAPSPSIPWILNNNPELSSAYGESPPASIREIEKQASTDSSSAASTLLDTHRSGPIFSKKCDISVGRWVEDGDNYPLYPPDSCPFVDEAFDCQRNGRPDAEYLKWRWEPKDCHIPRFDARNMLEKLRGKRLVFAGDSLMRNQWESMLCLLREGLVNKSRVLETSGNRITKGKGEYAFKFLDYNLKVEFYRSHFLMAEGKRRTITGKQKLTLRLDTIAKSAKKWRGADVLVFTTGHWWNHGKTAKGKDYFQEGNTVYSSLPVMVAFKKAVTTWASWVDKNIDPKRTKVFFSGYSPSHFSGGQWNSGGHCHNEKDPIFDESYIPSYPEKMYIVEDIINHMKNPVGILNITRFSEYRKDAHPSIFGQGGWSTGPRREDCSHWCLPGLPDIWNEALHALL